MKLNNFDEQDFLQNFWQKKPLLIRAGFSSVDWIEADELAGLACEEQIESRILLESKGQWQVQHGPFDDAHFAGLPETHWTLLVQAVDHWVPEVAAILNYFRFLPAWRLDDIMVSYAPVGGTVAQHYDFYDVFLIQGEGSRVWQIGQRCSSESVLLADTPVKILQEFEATMEVTLVPGDILYIPARYAHYGVSIEDSLTYSVGFRAPSVRDIVEGVSNEALARLAEDQRYQDSLESLAAAHGEIPSTAVEQIRQMFMSALSDPDLFQSWLGSFVTERKYPEAELIRSELDDWQARLEDGERLIRQPGSRFAYSVQPDGVGAQMYVDGEGYHCALALAKLLCEAETLDTNKLLTCLSDAQQRECLEALLAVGALVFEDDLEWGD